MIEEANEMSSRFSSDWRSHESSSDGGVFGPILAAGEAAAVPVLELACRPAERSDASVEVAARRVLRQTAEPAPPPFALPAVRRPAVDTPAATRDDRGMERPIRVLLVDDQDSVRCGLRMRLTLEDDVVVAGEAADGEAAVAEAERLRPDVVLMDVEMPGSGGIAACRRITEALPGTPVIMLSLYDDTPTRQLAHLAGAQAFIAKHEIDRVLLAAIRAAAGPATRAAS
jgi:CheY-like chemotaxis protein